MEGRGSGGHCEGLSFGNEHRLLRSTRVSGRDARRQACHSGRHQPHRRVSARRVRREGEEARLVDASALPAAGVWRGKTKWVFPDTFFDQLPLLLHDAAPLAGEEPRYAALRELIAAARRDPKLKAAMIDEATRADEDRWRLTIRRSRNAHECLNDMEQPAWCCSATLDWRKFHGSG